MMNKMLTKMNAFKKDFHKYCCDVNSEIKKHELHTAKKTKVSDIVKLKIAFTL